MYNVEIKITGPGGCVNSEVAIVYKALKDAGYSVKLDDFHGKWDAAKLGMFANTSSDSEEANNDWAEKQLRWLESFKLRKLLNTFKDPKEVVTIKVNSLPWGG